MISNFLLTLKIPKLKSIQLSLPSLADDDHREKEAYNSIFKILNTLLQKNNERVLKTFAFSSDRMNLEMISETLLIIKSLQNLKIGFRFNITIFFLLLVYICWQKAHVCRDISGKPNGCTKKSIPQSHQFNLGNWYALRIFFLI